MDNSSDNSMDSPQNKRLLALQVKGVHKFYGRGRGAYHALRSLNMEVQYGSIYGLLGASGCGKTTLLRCVLGRLPIQSGHILILGKPPGTRGHSVPGKGVGYMPQEEALALKLTMREMMYYFGILFSMELQHIKERTDLLKEFLDLPSADALCGKLSGGQKRRVSLAVALLHEPPLLILDEPTVGLDPLLRAKIWQYLLEITSAGDTTVLITTHYIEEARQAHMVGLMRTGRLLAQSSPEELITSFGVTNLEDVFLKILEQQQGDHTDKITSRGVSIQQSDQATENSPLLGNVQTVNYPSYFSGIQLGVPRLPKLANVVALCCKEALKFVRQPLLLFRLIIITTINLAIICFIYGQDLRDIKMYYNNHDTAYHSDFFNGTFDLGRSFLSHIDHDTLDLKLASDVGEGVEKIEEGYAWGYFSVPKNYSQNYIDRLVRVCEGVEASSPVYPDEVSGAAIEMILDVTSTQLYYTMNATLLKAVLGMRRDFLRNTSIPEFYFNPSLNLSNVVYGGNDLDITDFVAPGIIAGMTLAVAIGLTSTNLIVDRIAGLYDRTWVAGVSVIEVVTSQMITYGLVALLQDIPEIIVGVYVFNVIREGNILLVFLIAYLAGICGITIGLMISTYVSDVAPAIQITVAMIYPFLLIGGVFWPLQGFDHWLRVVSHLTPVTYPAEAIRSVLLRGWGLGDEPVYLAIITLCTYIVIFLTVTCVGLQLKKY
ncbi:ABC transporter G family member 20-like [Dysidea avara]|uniref:ABC transporter G family member 20-like n=1 Tax=Dysidea avara TaxID=196820 RepID=UPI00332527E3